MKHLMTCCILVTVVAFSSTQALAETISFPVDETTNGEDINFVAPIPTDPNAGLYRVEFVVTEVYVFVPFLSFTIPVDITEQLDPNLLDAVVLVDGPAPIPVNSITVSFPPPPDDPNIAADIDISLDSNGFAQVDVTNVKLGAVTVDVPDVGTLTVEVLGVQLVGTLTITAYQFGDVNCSGQIDASDISPFIAALLRPTRYEELFEFCSLNLADMNGDQEIDASDISPFIRTLLSQ